MQMLSLFQASLGWAWINSPPAWPGCFSLEWVGMGWVGSFLGILFGLWFLALVFFLFGGLRPSLVFDGYAFMIA